MIQTILRYTILLLFISTFSLGKSQPSVSGYPAGRLYQLSTSNIPIINLPFFNNDTLIAADTCESCGEAFGVDAMSEFDFWENAEMQIVYNEFDSVEIYRVRIVSPSANALHVIFSSFKLNHDEQMFIYSPNDSNRILGAFTIHNNKPDSSFTGNAIFDSEMIIEVNKRPKSINEIKGILKVRKFIHVFKNRNEFGVSLNCNNNVICAPWYNDFCNQIRSVVKYYLHQEGFINWFICSGAVVNGGNGNFDPIILTAGHCIQNGTDHANWEIYFNFQSITCNPSSNGNDLMMMTGVNTLASDGGANNDCPDIAVMRLREPIPLQYNVFHSGWSRLNLTYPQDGVGIHHPRGDVKKISFGPITNPLFNSCLKVTWTNGLTELGSSGSPLFASKQVVAVFITWYCW